MTIKRNVLMGATALVMTTGVANATELYGNGASLPSQVVRQAADCYGQTVALSSKVAQGTANNFTNPPAATIPGTTDTCDMTAVKEDPTATIYYVSTGSGDGIRAVYRNDGVLANDYLQGGGLEQFPELHYGVSETSLGVTDVNAYNNGGVVQSTTVVAPGVSPGAGQFKNPNEFYGPLVQFPLLIAPVVIAYDPVYKKVRNADDSITEYTFNIANPRSSGGLRLDSATYCKIFNGKIKNWKDLPKKLNGGQSYQDPDDAASGFNVPMQIVGRSDSSGTTSLWTRHLAAVCGNLTGNVYADASNTLPLQGPVYDANQPNNPVAGETPGLYTRASGNEGVSKYINFSRDPGSRTGASVVQGRIGYLSADFALPAADTTGSNNYNLHTATLKNASGSWVAPSPDSAKTAFGTLLPPDSTSSGAFQPGADGSARSRTNPQDWVEAASKNSVLANPTGKGSYPIVGTSNFLGYTCYNDGAERDELVDFLKWYEDEPVVNDNPDGILYRSGFSSLPSAWHKAIKETFLAPTGSTSSLGLQIKTAGQSGVCSAKVGAAPLDQ